MEKAFCEWTYEGLEDYWATACGHAHGGVIQKFLDGGPSDNKYVFCPFCGKEILELERF